MKIMFNCTLKILPVLIAVTCLVQPVFAAAIQPTLTLTEVLSTQLNWSWDASGGGTSGTITTLTPDHWVNADISGPNLNQSLGAYLVVDSWTEPEGGSRNIVVVDYIQSTSTTFAWQIPSVFSDVSGSGNLPDGLAVDTSFGYNLAFFDHGDIAGVPDSGTTLSLLVSLRSAWLPCGANCAAKVLAVS
jgi:hypothetical protein